MTKKLCGCAWMLGPGLRWDATQAGAQHNSRTRKLSEVKRYFPNRY